MLLKQIAYDRQSAVAYANKWAYSRNPEFYDFSKIGGDCTNFASQCVYAGCKVMNFTPIYGWYYISVNNRAPAWTSVEYIYNFLTTNNSVGPYAVNADITMVEPGDLVQIKFLGSTNFNHTPVITEIRGPKTTDNIFISAHSYDCDYKSLSAYNNVIETRFLHILGARYQEI